SATATPWRFSSWCSWFACFAWIPFLPETSELTSEAEAEHPGRLVGGRLPERRVLGDGLGIAALGGRGVVVGAAGFHLVEVQRLVEALRGDDVAVGVALVHADHALQVEGVEDVGGGRDGQALVGSDPVGELQVGV